MTDATALSGAYRTLLDVIGKVEPRICQAIRDELTNQRAKGNLISITSLYRHTRNSAQPSEPPGWPEFTACTIRKMSLRT